MKSQETEINIEERVQLINNMPKEGKIEDLCVARDILKKIYFTQEELMLYGLKTNPDGSVSWNEIGRLKSFKYKFTKMEIDLFINTFIKMSNAEVFPMCLMRLYDLVKK